MISTEIYGTLKLAHVVDRGGRGLDTLVDFFYMYVCIPTSRTCVYLPLEDLGTILNGAVFAYIADVGCLLCCQWLPFFIK